MWKQSIRAILIATVLALVLGGSAYGDFNADTDPSLVALWRLNDGAGTTAVDSSPNGNDGALQGDPQWVVGTIEGALELDGDGDFVDCGNDAVFDITEQLTLAIWVNANDMGNSEHNCWLGKGDSAYAIKHQSGNNVEFFIYDGDWNSINYTTGLETLIGEWHHMTGTFDGDELVLYLDGEVADTLALSSTINAATHNVTLGENSQATGRYFDGMLDDARIYNRALTQEEIQIVMLGGAVPELAGEPVPEDEATDVPPDDDLSWTPGVLAATHDVYLGTSFDDVNDANRANPLGVLVSESQSAATYDPGRFEFGQTYYWRIDEVNGAPDNTIFKGDVWSFSAEPLAYPVQNIIATSNAIPQAGAVVENTINGSGLNADDLHSADAADMFLGLAGDDPVYLQYEFDAVYKLHEVLVWNYNVQFELMLGFGIKDVTVKYSENGVDWTVLGEIELAQATALPDYAANTTIDFGGVAAKFVKLTVNSSYGTFPVPQYGLSEIRFMFIPASAREPQPADDAADVSVETTLAWRAARDALAYDVYFGTDAEALALAETVDSAGYAPGALDLEATYYWKVDAVQDAESWEGPVWSFSTQAYRVVDDFESYTDDIDAGQAIFMTWIDGYEMPANGSTVGHIEAPFAEQTIVNNGSQSMPMFYDNSGTSISEAELALAQNWTGNGIKSLSLYFHGAQDNTGQLYVKINGTKVVYDGAATDIAQGQWQPWNIDLSIVGGNLSNVATLIIGVEGAGAAGVLYIDDIRLYPKTPEFVTPVEPDAAGLVLHYAFDDGAGMVAADSSGNGNNGTLDGDPTWITGVSGGALDFDGTRDYVTTGMSLLSDLAEFTIACWLKGDLSLGDRSGLIGQNDCVEYGISASNNVQIWTAGGGGAVNLPWSYDSGADWHHIVAVGDGSSVTIYLDGKLAVSGGSAIDGTYGASTFPVNVAGGGVFDAADNWFTGQIDEVYVYQRALSAAEVAGLAGRTEPVAQAF